MNPDCGRRGEGRWAWPKYVVRTYEILRLDQKYDIKNLFGLQTRYTDLKNTVQVASQLERWLSSRERPLPLDRTQAGMPTPTRWLPDICNPIYRHPLLVFTGSRVCVVHIDSHKIVNKHLKIRFGTTVAGWPCLSCLPRQAPSVVLVAYWSNWTWVSLQKCGCFLLFHK